MEHLPENLPIPMPKNPPKRWELIRDVAVFQLKLVIDGVLDVLLGPVTWIAAILGLMGQGKRSDEFFYKVLNQGRRVDRWINLFGNLHEPPEDSEAEPQNLDEHLRRLEQMLIAQNHRGGVTSRVKSAIDEMLDSLQKTNARHETGVTTPPPLDDETTEPGNHENPQNDATQARDAKSSDTP